MSQINLNKFLHQVEQNKWNIHGMIISENSSITAQYGDVKSRYPIYSATKSITSSAVGIAVEENRFSIEAPLYEYIKSILPLTVSQKQAALTKQVSIERLLTMSVKDLPFRPEGNDWLTFSLNHLPEDIETAEFYYSNISAYLVAVALQCALGTHLMDYLMPRFFEPLQIALPDYQNDPTNYFYGASGMQLSVEELAKIGELYLGKGTYQGRCILSEEWVNRATTSHIMNREGGYGYFIWKYRDGFRISGKWGQRSIVLPDPNRVITYLSDMPEGSGDVTRAIEIYILGGTADDNTNYK